MFQTPTKFQRKLAYCQVLSSFSVRKKKGHHKAQGCLQTCYTLSGLPVSPRNIVSQGQQSQHLNLRALELKCSVHVDFFKYTGKCLFSPQLNHFLRFKKAPEWFYPYRSYKMQHSCHGHSLVCKCLDTPHTLCLPVSKCLYVRKRHLTSLSVLSLRHQKA